jgi:prevent-host-death family protein
MWPHDAHRRFVQRHDFALATIYTHGVQRYSVTEARAKLPAILAAVEAGSDVELTRRGRSVAVIVARHKYRSASKRPGFAELYAAWRARHPNGVGLPDGYFEALRDRSPGRK